MTQRTCLACGEKFTPPRSDSKCCSKRCGQTYHRDSLTKTCTVEGCNRPLRARGMCASHYNAKRYVKPDPQATTCTVCGVKVIRHVQGTRNPICSYRCRGILRRRSARPSEELVGPVPKVWPPAYRLPKPMAQSSGSVRFAAGQCTWCGEWFTHDMRVTGVASRQCSERCTKKAAKARRKLLRGVFAISRRRRVVIYERDNWTCQLCGEPVDASLPPLHDYAASLDHIECQSWTLIPDHSDANLRLAHRLCNSIRQDKAA